MEYVNDLLITVKGSIDDSTFETINNVCLSLLLGILGIAITIFTVVYSFMENNKQVIRNLRDTIKIAETVDPVKESDLQFANDYMHRLKSFNTGLIVIIISNVLILLLFGLYLLLNNFTLGIITYVFTTILIVYCMIHLVNYLWQYYLRYKNV